MRLREPLLALILFLPAMAPLHASTRTASHHSPILLCERHARPVARHALQGSRQPGYVAALFHPVLNAEIGPEPSFLTHLIRSLTAFFAHPGQ